MGRDPAAISGGNEREVHRRLGDHMTDAVEQGAEPMKVPAQTAAAAAFSPSNRSEVQSEFVALERWVPWMVPSIVVANFVVFWVTMYVNNCPANSSSCMVKFLGRFAFQPFKENPFLGPSAYTLENMGALDVDKVTYKHQFWRLVSCVWLHAGVFHLLANMLSLLFIGIRLEQEFGFVRVGIIYLISGFGGSLLSSLFVRSGISVGASGALFGLLGGMVSELIMNWTIYSNKFVALTTLLLITLLNLGMGVLPHVDNFAHIGGFLSGFLLGFLLLIRPQFGWATQKSSPHPSSPASSSVEPKHKLYQYLLWLLALVLLIVGFTMGLVALLRGDDMNERCSWCHYLTCVPTATWHCGPNKASCSNIPGGENQFNLTCLSNGRSTVYASTDNQSNSSSWLLELCTQLCS